MKLTKCIYYFSIITLLISCTAREGKQTKETSSSSSSYTLQPTKECLTFNIDESTYIPLSQIFYFKDSAEYIAFVNREHPEICIYDVHKKDLYKKIRYRTEGNNSIARSIGNIYIKHLNEIYLDSPYATYIYKSDSSGYILNRYDFSKTDKDEPLTTMVSSMGRFEISDDKIYLTQNINRAYGSNIVPKSSLAAIVDTARKEVRLSAVKFPPLITDSDLGTNAGFGYQYRRTFDGKHFIYSFLYSDTLYRVSSDHQQVTKVVAKSRYIPHIKINRLPADDFNRIIRTSCEEATYEDILYDKYRNVYYRFACPETTLDEGDDPLEVVRYGKKQFSILILDENLQVIGETLFPAYTYVPTAHFITKDGLYLSRSHYKNEAYSDDCLCFEKIELVKNHSF